MFTPIRTAADLPAIGRSNERFYLDFKSEPSVDGYENAKDVAAFANGDGGTILIGAKGSGEYLAEYKPLDTKAASAAQRAIDQAVRDRCAPVPLFDPVWIETDGGIILAVNVWPFPGQVVGVELKKGEAKCGAAQTEPQGVYFFPRRVGAQMTSIRPEQIPMFMDARIRRFANSLQAAVGQMIVLQETKPILEQSNSSIGTWMEAVCLREVDLAGNALNITVRRKGKAAVEMGLPFDAIEAVWREGKTWRVALRGQLRHMKWLPDLNEPELEGISLLFEMR